jgi:multiple sugar transport system ATP-binding protein
MPFRILVRGRTSARPGEVIHLRVSPDLVHIFDAGPVPEMVLEDAA